MATNGATSRQSLLVASGGAADHCKCNYNHAQQQGYCRNRFDVTKRFWDNMACENLVPLLGNEQKAGGCADENPAV
jgi:hypothetical protein